MSANSHVILDTNVLIHEPQSIHSFENRKVFIPFSVIEELDHFSKFGSELGRNARRIIRELDNLQIVGGGSVKLPNQGEIIILPQTHLHEHLPKFADLGKNSNRTLSSCLEMLDKFGADGFELITNDANLRVRARALGVKAISYSKADDAQWQDQDRINSIELPPESIETLLQEYEVDCDDKQIRLNKYYKLQGHANILLRCHYPEKKLKVVDDFMDGVWGVKPKNPEQRAAFDALMDPRINLVILSGKAGTGKTLLAIASALEQMLTHSEYHKCLISRPIAPMGKDLGYLPGNLEEKLAPWMQPIFDNLEFLTSRAQSGENKSDHWKKLMEKNLIEIEPLTYIRGRSIPNRFLIVDEAQNLTPHEVKTIVTRAGHHSKFVLTGDPYQIDNPYVDEVSNGLSYIKTATQDQPLVASVTLHKGERSALAEMAANLL